MGWELSEVIIVTLAMVVLWLAIIDKEGATDDVCNSL